MNKIFISGSITIKIIDNNIKQRLDNIISNGHTVLIGDAKGADLLVQSFLKNKNYSAVNIYCSGQMCRNNVGNWHTVNVPVPAKTRGRQFYMVKDKQMALDSDYGFMLWDGRSAGTINNLLNLVTNEKTGLIYLQPKQTFRTIKNVAEFKEFLSECDSQSIDVIDKKISFRKKLESYNLPVQEQLAFSAVSEPQDNAYGVKTDVTEAKTNMAKKKAAPKKQKSMEESLWDSANKLRGKVESSEYKHVVLGLIFLKFASDKFEERKQELIAEGKEKYVDMVEFYTMNNVFFLPEESRWKYLKKNAKQNDIALKIDTALATVEKNNPSLKGALPDNYYSRLDLDVAKLASLLDTINNIDTLQDKEQDIVGRVYEYFLSKFALAEGKGKGEFYTPKCIVNLLAGMIEPYGGTIYDPCCGSGGMFVQSVKFIESHHGNKKNLSIYGQEYTSTTYKLAKMNLAIRGISGNLGDVAENTFFRDQHKDLKADYIMANPPFNQKQWRADNELTDDDRWNGYEVPPTGNANYAWILHMVSKLSENGVAGFILANGALSGGGDEYKIRRKMIENNLVEAILVLPIKLFYTTDISVTIWILNKNKKAQTVEHNSDIKNYRNREREILFLDLRQWGEPYEKKYVQLSDDDLSKITETYHTWQSTDCEGKYSNTPEYCYSADFEEIEKKDFSLVPSKYIEFINRDENIDFEAKMKGLQSDFSDLLKQEESSKGELLKVFRELGYEIKL